MTGTGEIFDNFRESSLIRGNEDLPGIVFKDLKQVIQGVVMNSFKEMVDLGIFIILGFMGFLALWCTIERYIFMRKFRAGDHESPDAAQIALTRNMTTLFIVYSNAPYVGLLGTVLGIMITFYDMGQSGGLNARDIMVGMSLALKATALGLVVAIPALIAYNGLTRKISVIVGSMTEKK